MAYFGATSLAIVDAGRVGFNGALQTGCRYCVPSRVVAGQYRLTFQFPLTKADMIFTMCQTNEPALGGNDNKTWVVDWEIAADPAVLEIRIIDAIAGTLVDATWEFRLEYLGPPGVGVA